MSLILWLQSPSVVILEPKKTKSATASTFSLPNCHEVMVLDAMILVFQMLSFKPAFIEMILSAFLSNSLSRSCIFMKSQRDRIFSEEIATWWNRFPSIMHIIHGNKKKLSLTLADLV